MPLVITEETNAISTSLKRLPVRSFCSPLALAAHRVDAAGDAKVVLHDKNCIPERDRHN